MRQYPGGNALVLPALLPKKLAAIGTDGGEAGTAYYQLFFFAFSCNIDWILSHRIYVRFVVFLGGGGSRERLVPCVKIESVRSGIIFFRVPRKIFINTQKLTWQKEVQTCFTTQNKNLYINIKMFMMYRDFSVQHLLRERLNLLQNI